MPRRARLAVAAATSLTIAVGAGILVLGGPTGLLADDPGQGPGPVVGDPGPAHCPIPEAATALLADHGAAAPPGDGKGRLRLCLGSPTHMVLEQDASCAWSTDRSEVAAVEASLADPFPADSRLGLWLSTGPDFGRPLSIETRGRLSALGGFDRVRLDVREAGAAGTAEFTRVRLDPSGRERIDPRRDVGPSAVLAGTISWRCGVAPPMDPGRSRGTIDAALALPVGGRWSLPAVCSWVQRQGGPVVVGASTDNHPAEVGDQSVGFDAFAPAVLVYSRDGRYASYDILAATIVDRTANGDSSRGLVEFRGLGREPPDIELKLGGPGGAALLSGSMAWTCEPAVGPVPPDSGG